MPLEHAIAILIGVVLALLAGAYALVGGLFYQVEEEPSEFGAGFDALQAEKDEAAKSRARCREREAINRAADRLIASAKYGPPHDGVEL